MEPRCESSASETRMDSSVRSLARAAKNVAHFRHGHGDREDDYPLKHVHHLLRDERVNREAALRQRREEECGEQNSEGMVAPNESYGDSKKPRAARESVFVVMLVAEDVV